MQKTRLEWKVGLFVLISLALLVALILRFSKGTPLFAKTYRLEMKASSVGGIIPGAVILMAGVPIGNVVATDLDPGGRSVTITLEIEDQYKIYSDAKFLIKQAGFLGDQFVAVVPTENKGRILKNHDQVYLSEGAFDLEAAARSATGVLEQIEQTAATLNEAVARVDRELLNHATLTNLSVTLKNFRAVSEKTLETLEEIQKTIQANVQPLSRSLSNWALLSEDLATAGEELRELISTNRTAVASTLEQVQSASDRVEDLLDGLEKGEGLAGSILKNEELKKDFEATLHNASILTSNLNKFGLLYKPRIRRTNVIRVPYQGRSPF